MSSRSWENVAWAGLLAVCLLVGLAIGAWAAPRPAIGVLRFEGIIDLTSTAQLLDILESARQDDGVAGVVLEIASPGGLATSSESLFYELLQLRAAKPVVVVVDGIAVSGGYYAAAAANRIYAPASAYVGNVGTRGPRPDDPRIEPAELSSGPYKLTGGDRFDGIRQLDLVKDAFVNHVVHQRTNAEVNPLKIDAATVAEARVYLGSEAIGVGLVDFEGSRSDAILAAAHLAGVRDYAVVDMLDYFGIETVEPRPELEAAVETMMDSAAPEAVFLLDSRIPLPGLSGKSAIQEHMLHLRQVAPASLSLWQGLAPHSAGSSTSPAAKEDRSE